MLVLWMIAFWAFQDVSKISAFGSCKLDLGMVVDTTKSIGEENIPLLKDSLKHIIRRMGVSPSGTHVSFETFAADSVLHNTFNDASFHNTIAMENLISNSIKNLTKITRLDFAIFKADEEMFNADNRRRIGVSSVLLMFTDGKSHPTTNFTKAYTAVRSLQQKGVRIVSVAIGKKAYKKKFKAILQKIAGENILYVDDYPSLENFVGDIQSRVCPPSDCDQPKGLDVAFLLDRTKSISREDYRAMKGFVLQLVDSLKIGPDATHAAFILFHKDSKILNYFNDSTYHSNEATHNLIAEQSDARGSRTFIDKALKKADEELFTVRGGSRPGVPKVLILFTDGKTNSNSEPYDNVVRNLENKNVHIVAVGIGKKNLTEELKKIAKANVYYASNVEDLPNLFRSLLEETCNSTSNGVKNNKRGQQGPVKNLLSKIKGQLPALKRTKSGFERRRKYTEGKENTAP